MHRILFISLLISGLFFACQKTTDNSTNLDEQLKLEQEDLVIRACFEYVYPLDVKLRNGEILTINDNQQMRRLKASCDQEDHRRCFVFIYPVSIILKDGTVKEINSDEQMKRVYAWCNGEDKMCFVLVYPITYLMPDGSMLTIGEDNKLALKRWYEANPGYDQRPIMRYPVEIKYRDGRIITIANEQQMQRAKNGCDGD